MCAGRPVPYAEHIARIRHTLNSSNFARPHAHHINFCVNGDIRFDQEGRGMSVIAGVFGALPPHRYSQSEITDQFVQFPGLKEHEEIVRRLHAGAKVNSRHLVLPLEHYSVADRLRRGQRDLHRKRGGPWLRGAAGRARRGGPATPRHRHDRHHDRHRSRGAVAGCPDRRTARLPPGRAPDAAVRPWLRGRRSGCGPAARLSARRARRRRGPGAVELCSLTFPTVKPTVSGLVGTAMFGDGAAAVVAVGDRRAEPTGRSGPAGPTSSIRAAASTRNRCTSWAGTSAPPACSLVLSPELTTVIERHLADDVNRFLATHGLTTDDIEAWVAIPGARKYRRDRQKPRAAPGGA